MRSKVVRTLALALTLGSVSFGMAQQPSLPAMPGAPGMPPQGGKPASEKSKLEAMLAEALRNNPDIRVAAAKLAEADAELNRTRLLVTQKVVTHHQAILSQKAVVVLAQKRYEHAKTRRDQGIGDDWDEALAKLEIAKAKLTEAEAELPYLLGRMAQVESRKKWEEVEWVIKVQSPLTERIRKALQTSVKVDYKEATLSEILKDLHKKAPGLSFQNFFPEDGITRTYQFEETLPVFAVLQAIADGFGRTMFVREYGILVKDSKDAPPGALTVEQFLRQKPPEK